MPTVVSSLTVSSWPCGQVAGSPDWLIGRVSKNVSPQARQRYSYCGTGGFYRAGPPAAEGPDGGPLCRQGRTCPLPSGAALRRLLGGRNRVRCDGVRGDDGLRL